LCNERVGLIGSRLVQTRAVRGRRSNRQFRHENLVMSAKNPVVNNEKAAAVVADDWEETLKRIGGSQSDD
jgi:hypothetical protein